MITVLLAISSMKDLLRQSQEQFVHSQQLVAETRGLIGDLERANQDAWNTTQQLNSSRALLEEFQTTLQWAIQEGLPNIAMLAKRRTRINTLLSNEPNVNAGSWSRPFEYFGGNLTVLYSAQGYLPANSAHAVVSMVLRIDGQDVSISNIYNNLPQIHYTLGPTVISSPFHSLSNGLPLDLQPGWHTLTVRPGGAGGLLSQSDDWASVLLIEIN
jgi:hypothetical protein